MENSTLQKSSWLAKRLGISITTLERLRVAGSPDIPPAIQIGRSFRYDESFVEQWLHNRLQALVAQASIDSMGGHVELAA
jgi:predicted DNA-binding transcriptional regulator AlpA